MKSSLSVLFFFLTSWAYAQSFAPPGGKWHIQDLTGFAPSQPCLTAGMRTIEVFGLQPQVQGKNVVLMTDGIDSVFFHEDSGRIYFYENDTFHLYMDMNLTVGDTLFHRYPSKVNGFSTDCACRPSIGENISVVIKDSVLSVGGFQLKQLWLFNMQGNNISADYDTIVFTERIGNRLDVLFGPRYLCFLGQCCNDALLCYEDNDISIDLDSLSQNCVYTWLKEESLKEITTVYPNPATNTLHISTTQPLQNAALTITNAIGQIIHHNSHFGQQTTLTLTPWPAGIYFIKITTPQTAWFSKFIKQ